MKEKVSKRERLRRVLRLAYPITEFAIAAIFELVLLVIFSIQGLHLLLGAFNNYEERFAGFFMYLFRVLSVLLGMIFAEEAMRHVLTRERHHQFLTMIYFAYLLVLSCIFAFGCPEIFGLSNPWLLIFAPVLSGIGFIVSFSKYFYIKNDPDSGIEAHDDDEDEFDEEDYVDENVL